MDLSDHLSKLDRAIKDAEIRIRTFQTSIGALDKEIESLTQLESTLEENIKNLKAQRIIAIAQEYKKAKEELKKVKSRIVLLSNDREHYRANIKDASLLLENSRKEYEKINTSNNILDFPGK